MKTFARRAAKDKFDTHARSTDSSVAVRVRSIKSLSAILLKVPHDEEAQSLWSLGVFPLCVDPETSVQSCALEAAGRAVFDRGLTWFESRRNKAPHEAPDCIWRQVANLDGVVAGCLQKALRVLMKSDKIDVETIIKTCVFVIK
ncbi:hypothetical protein GN958_ATG21655 [Phytophthora infestans]|uniref:Uncharacterized protein n=1 Tax=Phytophthora infestans TaxID=4787 RepID=A0A8S9TQZ2_PHYIN|nr:hypothetical protein GN958_ATG21655 [Phytophthora infestans]